jgi:HD-like signal output (HDOD) protein
LLATLRNFFSSSPAKSRRATRIPQGVAKHNKKTIPNQKSDGIILSQLDTAFYELILGIEPTTDCDLNAFEKKSLNELDELLKSDISHSNLVPRLPAVIPKVMVTLRDQSSSAADLASELGRDAVLVSEVIRLSNTPYYNTGQEISSLERAVFVLGQTGVRQLVANAALKPMINLNSGHFTKLCGTTLWDHSEKTAIICDCMAKQEKIDRFNAYLMAVVQNVGFTVILRLLDRNHDGSQAPRSKLFQERLINHSRKLSWLITKEWGFPEPVIDALKSQIDNEQMQTLGNILYSADKLSKMQILSARECFKGDIEQVTKQLQDRLPDSCTDCFESLTD